MGGKDIIKLVITIISPISLLLATGCTVQRIPNQPPALLKETTKVFLKRHGVVFDQKLVSDIDRYGANIGAMDPSIQSYYNFLVETREFLAPYTRSSGRILFKGTYYENDVALALITIFTLGIFAGVSDGHMKISFYDEGHSCQDLVIRYNEQRGGWLAAPLALLPAWRFQQNDNLIEREGLVKLLNDLPEENQKFLVGECSDYNRFGRVGREGA